MRSVSVQSTDDQSILNHYKSLIALKKQEVFSLGDIQNLDFAHSGIIAFTRSYKDESVAVIHNLTNEPVELKSVLVAKYETLVWQKGSTNRNDAAITIPARGSVVYKKQ